MFFTITLRFIILIMRKLILICFFLLQLLAIFFSMSKDEKYFAWVPFDLISTYRIHVEVDSKFLSKDEIFDRYKMRSQGRENRSISHVFSQIAQYEESYGYLDSAKVKVYYIINGKEEKEWNWPK